MNIFHGPDTNTPGVLVTTDFLKAAKSEKDAVPQWNGEVFSMPQYFGFIPTI
jgi:hypothetical protein